MYAYEKIWMADYRNTEPVLLEAYSGTQVVQWYGSIERQIQTLVKDAEASRNHPYADKLRTFLTTWREYRITGAINRETLDPLETASNQLAVDGWRYSNYFSNLRDRLRTLVASEEELPRGMAGAGGKSAPSARRSFSTPISRPPTSDFGSQEDEPKFGGDDGMVSAPDENNTEDKK